MSRLPIPLMLPAHKDRIAANNFYSSDTFFGEHARLDRRSPSPDGVRRRIGVLAKEHSMMASDTRRKRGLITFIVVAIISGHCA